MASLLCLERLVSLVCLRACFPWCDVPGVVCLPAKRIVAIAVLTTVVVTNVVSSVVASAASVIDISSDRTTIVRSIIVTTHVRTYVHIPSSSSASAPFTSVVAFGSSRHSGVRTYMQSSRARHKQERQDRQDCQLAESAERHVCRELRAAMGKRSRSPVESGVPAQARTRDCAEGNVIKAQGQGKEDSAGSKGKEATAGLQGKEGSADPQGKEGSARAQARGKDQNEAGQEGSGGPQGKEACAGFQPSERDWDYGR